MDLILESGRKSRWAIEIKSSERVAEREVRSFERLAKDLEGAKMLYLSQDPHPQRYGRVECLHWREGLSRIFAQQ